MKNRYLLEVKTNNEFRPEGPLDCRVETEFNGVVVRHYSPPPYEVIRFDSGYACVVGADKVNRIRFPADYSGQVMIEADIADALCEALNEAAGGGNG